MVVGFCLGEWRFMNGEIAQRVSVVCFGNADLSGQKSTFPIGHSTFQFCNQVHFVQVHPTGDRKKEIVIAEDYPHWIEYLKSRDVKILRLHHVSSGKNSKGLDDRRTAGFVSGGGRWLIEAVRDGISDIWETRWEVTDRDNKEKKIWKVTYGEIAQNWKMGATNFVSTNEAYDALKNAIVDIKNFAMTQNVGEYWVKTFNLALDCLKSSEPLDLVYHKDLIPKGLFEWKACQLLAAAQPAFVFGGMGSWNDMGFQGELRGEYERVSAVLFKDIIIAILSAVNSACLK
jgi:hypothetical protein